MPQYIVSYDLHQVGRDYARIKKGIEDLGEAAKLLESLWLVNHGSTAAEIRDYLTKFCDSNDSIAVIEIGPNWATKHCLSDGLAFMKRHRP